MTATETRLLDALKAEFSGDLADANITCGTSFETWEQLLDAAMADAIEDIEAIRISILGETHCEISSRLRREYEQRTGGRFLKPLSL